MRSSVTPPSRTPSGSVIVPVDPGQPSVRLPVSMDPPSVHIGHGWAGNVEIIVTEGHLDRLAAEEAKLAMTIISIGIGSIPAVAAGTFI